jgi:uncharacterized protein YecT (DUF1311 family)
VRRAPALATAAACLLAAASPGTAAGDDGPCPGTSTAEIVACLDARAAAWDRRLNAAYAALLARLAADGRGRDETLRAAQRLWVPYRDANCRLHGSGEGTIARIEAAACVERMARERALELERAAAGP